MAEGSDSTARPLLGRLRREGSGPGEFRKWFWASWPTIFMLVLIFFIALFVRTYFGYNMAIDNGYLVSGGSDSYYWERIIDHSAETGKQLYWDSMTNYPDGIRNPRPPFYSMSIVVPAVFAEGFFDTLKDATGFMFLWSTAFWGALTVIPTYFLGKEAFGRRVGLAGAFFLAVMPSHVQRSVFSNADHDAFILFFIVLTFFFVLKAVKTQEHKKWVENWKSIAGIKKGFADYFRESRTPVLYSLMAGVAFGSVIMAWVGFAYVAVLILAYYVVQVLVNRFKNQDSMSVTIIVFLTMGFGYLLSFPVYYEQSLIAIRFDVPVYLFLAAIAFGTLFVVSRDYPWTLALPAIGCLLAVALLAINFVSPALGEAILSGQGYFVKSKLYETIAEARAPRFSELAMSFGMVTFFLSLIGLIWAAFKIPKKATAAYILMVVWLAAAIFMAISAGRFMFNAAPAFAIAAAWVLVIIVDALDFNAVRKSLASASGSFFGVFKKSVKIRHILGVLFLAFMIVLPNVWYAIDAGIPQEVKGSYDKQIYSSVPSFMRPAGYDRINGSNWYLGAFGYSLPLPTQYFPAAWDWFAEQDADILPASERPAYVAWWDYGFECIQAGKHPTVADNFQYGYQLTGNVIMAQSETDAIALFAYRLIQTGLASEVSLKDAILALFEEHGVSSARMLEIYSGPGKEIVDEVLADPVKYGPMASDLSDVNARIVAARVELSSIGTENLVSLYDELCDITGWEIRYFNVDSRMFPVSGYQTGIFYAPAKLSDRRISEDASLPIDFFTIRAVTTDGREVDLDEITSDMAIGEYKIVYQDMFYDSMFYRAMVGFSGSDLGLENDGLPGYSGSLQNEQAMPGWNMSHFRMVYRTAYYNPYPASELYLGRSAWQAMSLDEAQEMREKISSGEIVGFVDDSAYSLYTAGLVFLKYYHGAFVNGTVTTEEGYPVAGVGVTIQDEYGIPHGMATTDAQGEYSLLAPFGEVSLVFSEGAPQNTRLQGATVLTTMKFNVTDAQAMREPQDLDGDGFYDYLITKDYSLKGANLVGDVFWDLDGDGNFTASTDELIPEVSVDARELRSGQAITLDALGGSFDGLVPPGSYDLIAVVNGWSILMATGVNVTSGGKSIQKLPLEPGVLRGNLTDEDGSPEGGVELVMRDLRVGYQTSTVTNPDGSYEFDRLVYSYYTLSTTTPGLVVFPTTISINSGVTKNWNVTVYPSSSITYTVMRGSNAVPYAAYMISDMYQPVYLVSGVADRNGRVQVDLPEGTYTLYATTSTGTSIYAGMTLLDATHGVVSGTLSLSPAVNVTGALKSPLGSLVKDEYVFFEAANGARVPAKTNQLASYDLRLPAGTYSITASSMVHAGIYSGAVVVGTNDIVGLQLRMVDGALLTGTLHVDSHSTGSVVTSDFGAMFKLKVTDSAGRLFTKTSGAFGSYSLMVPKNSPFTISLGTAGYSAWSTTMTLDGDEEGMALFAIPDLVALEGRVTCDGVGIKGVLVTLTPESSAASSVSVVSGNDGRFSVNLPPSDYDVSVAQSLSWLPGTQYQHESSLSVEPSASPLALEVQTVKRVLMTGALLSGYEGLRVELVGPESKVIYAVGSEYVVYLLEGTYTIYAKARTHNGSPYASLDSFTLSPSARRYDIQLEPASDVAGTITIGAAASTKPILVTAVSSLGFEISTRSTTQGDYTISLPRGGYTLSFVLEDLKVDGERTYYVEYYSTVQVTVGTNSVPLSPSLTARMDNTTFSGTVKTEGGMLISATVQLVPKTRYGLGATLSADATGAFSAQVQPGEYTLYVTRPQDGRVYMSTLMIARNTPLEMDLVASPGKQLSGKVTIGDVGVLLDVSVAGGSAKLNLVTDASGLFKLQVPAEGTYYVGASTIRTENGVSVSYGLNKAVEVGANDVFVDLPMVRDTKRTVSASWNKNLTQAAAPGKVVYYVLTVTNTGNIDDTFMCTYGAGGSEVQFTPSEFHLDFGTGNKTSVTVGITVSDSVPAGETEYKITVRSKTLSNVRVDVRLFVNVTKTYDVNVSGLADSMPVSSSTTYTKFMVNNTGNAEDSYMVQVANLPVLAELGWSAEVVDADTLAEVERVAVAPFSSKALYVKFTAVRAGPSQAAEAAVLAYSETDAGVSSYGFVKVLLPDLEIGAGDVTAQRDDVSYEYEVSRIYLDIVLFIALVSLIVTFVLMRRKKGLSGKGGGKK